MKRSTLLSIFLLLATISLTAQVRQTREEYIDRYCQIAVAHMERYGIPASITMAQGILESDAGNSVLSTSSNNHFGIKCKSNWKGRTVYHDDDAPQECFRAYPSVELSYQDHAEFLDNSERYDSLFNYSSSDYKSWARGLKAAGYATAPDYAPRLVKIIEDYKLYLLDRDNGVHDYASRHKAPAEQEWFEAPADGGQITTQRGDAVDPNDFRVTINAHYGYNIYRMNGVEYIIAKEDETLERIAGLFEISERNLRKFNELEVGDRPVKGEVIFIEKKKKRWDGNARAHIVHEGETIYSIAQSYAIRQSSLRAMNKLPKSSYELQVGQSIKLQ